MRDRQSPQRSRIARLLHVDIAEVQGLDDVPDDDLRAFHDQISRSMFADGQAQFARVAGLSKSIPGPLAGKLAERFLPPVLAARVSELLEPARARDLVGRVRVPYLADIAVALDPVESRPVVQALPAKRIGEVAREMFGRKEYAVMAEFVNTVTLDALFAALAEATPHDLLAVVPLLEWNDNLDHVIALLPDEQVQQIVDELDHAELAQLALELDPSRFGPIVDKIDVDIVQGIAKVLFEREEHEAMARFAGVVTSEMLVTALDVAGTGDLVAIAPYLEWNDTIGQVVDDLPDERVAALADDLVAGGHWAEGSALVEGLPVDARDRLLARAQALSESSFAAIVAAGEQKLLSPAAARMVAKAARARAGQA